jgi:hypothetical protein
MRQLTSKVKCSLGVCRVPDIQISQIFHSLPPHTFLISSDLIPTQPLGTPLLAHSLSFFSCKQIFEQKVSRCQGLAENVKVHPFWKGEGAEK